MATAGKAAKTTNAAKAKGGKPKMPEFNKLEELAVAQAAIAAATKPNEHAAVLRGKATELYPEKLKQAAAQFGWVEQQYGRPKAMWTLEKSIELRPTTCDFWTRFNSIILKAVRNVLTPALAKFYNADGSMPSGKGIEDARAWVLDAWYKYKVIKNKPVDVEVMEDTEAVLATSAAKAKVLCRGGGRHKRRRLATWQRGSFRGLCAGGARGKQRTSVEHRSGWLMLRDWPTSRWRPHALPQTSTGSTPSSAITR